MATLKELQRLFDAYEEANPGGGGGVTTLAALTDVNVAGASNGNILQFNGSSWVDADLALGGLSDVDTAGASNGQVLTFTGSGWEPTTVSGGGGSASYAHDSLTSGTVTAEADRLGGSALQISNPSAGTYRLTNQASSFISVISLYGNNTTLNASQEFVVEFDNSAISEDRRFSAQVYDASNGALVDQQATATVHTQSVSGNITTLTFPGMNGFGSGGFFIELR